MKKSLKIVVFSFLGFFLLGIVAAVLIGIFVPAEELEKGAEQHTKEQQAVRLKKEKAPPIEKTPPAPIDEVPGNLSASVKDHIEQIPIPTPPKTEFETIAEKLSRWETSIGIAKDYVASPFKADAKYKGKTIKIAGNIAKIERIAGDPYVHLDTTITPVMLVSCQVKASQSPVLEKLSRGQYITVVGKVTGSVGISVHLVDSLVCIPKSDFEQMPFKERLEKASYWVSAVDIAREYAANAEAASEKYDGEIVVMRGIIRNTIDNFGRPVIILETIEGSAWCFISLEMKSVFDKKKGLEVFVVGKVNGEAHGSWYLEDSLVGVLKK